MTDTTKAREFYRRRSSSYTPKMDGSDRYNLMADFAAQCVAEALKEDRARIAGDWRNFHYADCRLARDGECKPCEFIDTLKEDV